jgi:hypothetical protein
MTEAQLFDAYRETTFCADTPIGQVRIRVGQLHPQLDALLDESSTSPWAYITAWNPRSVDTIQHENEANQAALLRDLDDYQVFKGEGVGADTDWPPEPSLLVLGLPEADALKLGHYYGQNAIVVGLRGEAAQLLSCFS